jgi:predicted Zn-dependent protease
VLAFAFVAASFIARNSDLWLHLATGRLLAAGEYRFGTDPFAYDTETRYWANHAWLFDLGLFVAFSKFGGAALVALKAGAAAGTAGLMLLTARTRGPAWVALGCVLLAVLAMAPRLLLQPFTGSLLLLAACVCGLQAGGRVLRVVPVLVAVWVNVDAWFVLGPALVGLFWIGRRLDPDRTRQPAWPSWFVPAVLLACLVNPHHVLALRLPAELSPAVWESEFRTDPRFGGFFDHPWHERPLGAAGGYSPAAWAFLALFALGPVSFAANRPAVRSWRLAVWLPFAALAAWQSRLVPLFAVVAGPVTALNLREVWPAAVSPRVGRTLVLAAAAALAALGWVGWLTGVTARDRAAGWGVYSDPTLARAAAGVAEWRAASAAPPEGRVFATHPDVGHYLAWHAPGQRYQLDSRLALFAGAAGEFEAVSRYFDLLPGGSGALPESAAAVVLYDPDGGRLAGALRDVAGGRWPVLRIDGAAVLLAGPAAGTRPRFDPERAAFAGAGPLPVAEVGPDRLAEPGAWWQVRAAGRVGTWEADAATIYLRLAEAGTSDSPALPLLAVRAARAGIERDPRDPVAWQVLGRAYLTLGERSWERAAGAGLTPLERVRLLQAVGALEQAVLLNPDWAPAHDSLARVFLRLNVLDLAQRHAAADARLTRRGGRVAGEGAEAFDDRAGQKAARADALLAAVQDAENLFLVRTAGLSGDPLARARTAADLGLGRAAVDVLLASHPDLYGAAGLGLLADLLLQTGQAAECRTLLDRAELRRNPAALGYYELARKPNPDGSRWPYRLHMYDWLDLCQCAVAGRYSAARDALDRLSERLAAEERATAPRMTRYASALVAGDVGLAVPPAPPLARMLGLRETADACGLLAQTRGLAVTRADLFTVAGVLDLERGAAPAAAARFRAARALYAAPGADVSRPGESLAVRYDDILRADR